MNKTEKKTAELGESVGVLAEMSLMYLRAAIGAGATIDEALKLTQAYIAAMIFGARPTQTEV